MKRYLVWVELFGKIETVNNNTQPWLPKVDKVGKVEKEKKAPQPRIGRYRSVRKYEILHRPFDLKFRGKINKWLERLMRDEYVGLENILTPLQQKLVTLYLFPQGKKKLWLTQKRVRGLIDEEFTGRLRDRLVEALVKIWNEQRSG